MKYYVKIEHHRFGLEMEKETEHRIQNADDVFEQLLDYEYTFDTLYELMPEPSPIGTFDLDVVHSYIERTLSDAIEKEFNGCTAKVLEYENNSIILSQTFSLIDIMKKGQQEFLSDENYECSAAIYIDECLQLFNKEGVWQYIYDDDNYPIKAWYGIRGEEPEEKWTLISGKDSKLWNLTEEVETLRYIVDNSDGGFEVWYIYECGCYIPNIQDILSRSIMKKDSLR